MSDWHDGAPSYQLLSEKTPRARKEHVCTYCKKPIIKGEKYKLHVYLCDDVFTLDKAHLSCFYGGPLLMRARKKLKLASKALDW